MAGSYTKKEFGAGPEEQTLLKDSNGAARIVPKGKKPFISIFLFTKPRGLPLVADSSLYI